MGTVIRNNICKGEDMRYKQIQVNGVRWLEHRYVWTQANGEIPKGMQIHHINGKKLDNRLENLALVTDQENKSKMDMRGTGYQYRPKYKRPYMSRRKHNGKMTYGGYFGTPCGAYMASMMYFVGLNA